MDTTKPHYRLIGTEISLFTGKARAYLNWKGLPFTEVIASREVYRDLLLPLTNTTTIPALLLPFSPGQQPTAIQDTRSIIRHLESAHPNSPHECIPSTPFRAAAANLIELLSDQWLVIQAMYWRWAPRSAAHREFILSEFGNTMVAGAKGSMKRRLEVEAESKIKFYELLPGLGIDETVGKAVERQFGVLCGMLEEMAVENRFALGDRISLADFALYGPFYAHLLRDPVSGFIIRTQFPVVAEWIERIQGLARGGSWRSELFVPSSSPAFTPSYPTTATALETNDQLPESLKPLLRLLLADYLPVLLSSAQHLTQFLASGKTRPVPRDMGLEGEGWVLVPRGLGMHEFTYSDGEGGKAAGKRIVQTHGLWMVGEMVRELGEGERCGDVAQWAGLEKGLWEKVRAEMRGWELGRKKGRYVARKKEEGARL